MVLLNLAIILSFFSAIEKGLSLKIKRLILLFLILFITFLGGVRWNTGTDWGSYYYAFQQSTTYEKATHLPIGFEWGYAVLNYIINITFGSYTVFLLFFTFLKIYIKYKVITHRYFIEYGLLSLLIIYCYEIDIVSGRQALASSITFYSVFKIIDKKWFQFFLLVILASLFHRTAIVFLLAYPAFHASLSKNKLFILYICGFLISSLISMMNISNSLSLPSIGFMNNYLAQYETRFDLYIEGGITSASSNRDVITSKILGLTRQFLLVMPMLYLMDENNKRISGMVNIIILGTVIYNIMGEFSNIFLRLSGFFALYESLVIPYLIYSIKKSSTRYTLLILYILFFILRLLSSLYSYWDLYDPFLTIFHYQNYRFTY